MKFDKATLLFLCCIVPVLLFSNGSLAHAQSMWENDWSPDGRHIVFGMDNDIFMIDADGGEPENLTADVAQDCSCPVFSPNGPEIVYSCYTSTNAPSSGNDSQHTTTSVVSLNIETGSRNVLFENAYAATFSRDGQYASYIKNWMYNAIYDFRTGEETLFNFNGEQPPFFCGGYASFSVDATHFVTQFKYAKNTMRSNRYKIYSVSIKTGDAEMLDIGDTNVVYPEYSPEGERLLFSQYGADGLYHLKVHDVATGVVTDIHDDAGSETICGSWSPDGRHICYVLKDKQRSSLRVYDCMTGESENLFSMLSETGVKAFGELPETIELYGNIPNPFNLSTTIVFSVGKECTVDLVIYNTMGQRIRLLIGNAMMAPGRHDVLWDGSDDDGFVVSSGAYFYRLSSVGNEVVGSMMLVK